MFPGKVIIEASPPGLVKSVYYPGCTLSPESYQYRSKKYAKHDVLLATDGTTAIMVDFYRALRFTGIAAMSWAIDQNVTVGKGYMNGRCTMPGKAGWFFKLHRTNWDRYLTVPGLRLKNT